MFKKVMPALAGILLCTQTSFAAPPPVAAAPAKVVVKQHNTCVPMKLKSQNKNIVLDGTSDAGQIFLIKNQSAKSMWIDHPVKHPSASAGWSSYIRADEWSALFLDKKDFSLNCSVIQPGKVDTVDCAQTLSVCKPTHLTYTSSRKGSFWLVEGKPLKELMKALEKRGVK
jgi:hypothetical protein